MIKNISLFLSLATLLFSQITVAQSINGSSKGFTNNLELNYNIGLSQFYGDASNSSFFQKLSGETGIGQSLNIKKHLSPVFALGLNGFYGCAKSHKTTSGSGSAVDFSLTGNYKDINLKAYMNFNSLFWGYDRNRKLSFYGWLGIGYGFWSTRLTDNLTGNSRDAGDVIDGTTETYKTGAAVIPVGFGIDYRISEHWSVNAVGDFRTVLSDDVDVWRGGYKYDQLFFAGIGISYHINPGFGGRKSKSKKSKSKKSRSKEVKTEDPEEEGIKPIEAKPKAESKIISDIPIYDLDYSADRNKKSTSVKSGSQDVLLIKPGKPISKPTTKGVIYRVQILAKSVRLSDVNYLRNRYNLNEDVFETHQDGVYRYSVGAFSTYAQAVAHSRTLKNKGVTDAFVVVYKDGKRIRLSSELKR